MPITAEQFKRATGFEPEQDDLERCNCADAGEIGHFYCGWDDAVDLPRFVSGVGRQNQAPRFVSGHTIIRSKAEWARILGIEKD